MKTNAVAMFCEAVREEVGGGISLVGIVPDNISLKTVPVALPKLAIYVRLTIPTETKDVASFSLLLRTPAGQEASIGDFSAEFVRETCEESKAKGSPIATFYAHGESAPFAIPEEGRFVVILRTDDDTPEEVIGGINFIVGAPEQPNRVLVD